MPRPSVKERARIFVQKARPSIAGQGGHDALFAVACALAVGFGGPGGLSDADAWELISEYNATNCAPHWSDKDLLRKLDQARKRAKPGEIGKLLNADRDDYTGPRSPVSQPAPQSRSKPSTNAPPRGQPSANQSQRTPRTPLFEVRRFGEGAKPRTARTVRTLPAYSFTTPFSSTSNIESKKEASGKSVGQPPEPTPKPVAPPPPPKPTAQTRQRIERAAPVDVTIIWNETGEVWRRTPRDKDYKLIGNLKDGPKRG